MDWHKHARELGWFHNGQQRADVVGHTHWTCTYDGCDTPAPWSNAPDLETANAAAARKGRPGEPDDLFHGRCDSHMIVEVYWRRPLARRMRHLGTVRL